VGSPEARAATAALRKRLNLAPDAPLPPELRQPYQIIMRAGALASALDTSGQPAFPMSAASVDVMIELAHTVAASGDPADVYAASTALLRYSQIIIDMDTRRLRDRYGAPPQP
jgi:hypothetical protein